MATRTREIDRDVTRSQMITAALDIASSEGFAAISNSKVALAVGKGPSLVTANFVNWYPGHPESAETDEKKNLKCEALREAIRLGKVRVVESALAWAKTDKRVTWPPALHRQASDFLRSRKA